MPTYQFSKTVGLLRGIRAFLRIEAGATRGNTPDDIRRKQAQKLEAARQRIKKTRQQLARKEQRRRKQAQKLEAARQKLETARQTIKKTRQQLARKEQRRRKQAQKLEAARQTIKKTRQQLARKEQRLDQLKMRTKSHIDLGALPDFLIIGTEKGGTTFLYWTLCQHPYVEPATEKELHFFDTRHWFEKDVSWYLSQFSAPTWRDGRKVITGEASPYYLFHPFVPRRASTILPNVKLIALLRNPADRAYSAYNHKVAAGQEHLSFEEALAEEERRTAGELEKMLADENYHSPRYRKYSYLSRGIYVDQLQRWHKYFAPDQLLVLKSEDLFANPIGTVEVVREFLNLPECDMNITFPTKKRNRRTFQPMAPSTRQRLEQFFEPHNRRLYEYLGVDFGW